MKCKSNQLLRATLSLALLAFSFGIFGQAVSAAPMTSDDYFARGTSETAAGNNEAAVASLTKAIELNPKNWKAYGNRSASRFNTRDYQGALADINTCIAHLPPNNILNDLKAKIEGAIAEGNNQANEAANAEARRRMANQMLMNAIVGGGDFADPSMMISQAAARRGLVPSVAPGVPVGDLSDPATIIMMNAQRRGLMPGGGGLPVQRAAQPVGSAQVSTQSNTGNSDGPFAAAGKGGGNNSSPFADAESTSSNSAHFSDAPATTAKASKAAGGAKAGAKPSSPTKVGKAGGNSSPFAGASTAGGNSSPSAAAATSSGSNNPFAESASTASTQIASGQSPVALPPSSTTPGMTAQQYFDRGANKSAVADFMGAIPDYNEAIRLDPNFGKAYANRGSARFNTGDRKGALDDFDNAVRLLPDMPAVKALRDQIAGMVH